MYKMVVDFYTFYTVVRGSYDPKKCGCFTLLEKTVSSSPGADEFLSYAVSFSIYYDFFNAWSDCSDRFIEVASATAKSSNILRHVFEKFLSFVAPDLSMSDLIGKVSYHSDDYW